VVRDLQKQPNKSDNLMHINKRQSYVSSKVMEAFEDI